MSCPRCGGADLWDDNLWWGCNTCGYAGNDVGNTFAFAKDIPGLARSVDELRGLRPISRTPLAEARHVGTGPTVDGSDGG